MKNLFKNRTVVGLTAIVLSLIICFGITLLFNKALQSKMSVVRIIKDVKGGEQITADKIKNVDNHIKVLSDVKNNEPKEQIKEKYHGIKYEIAHFKEISEQYLCGELFQGLKSKEKEEYNLTIRELIALVFDESFEVEKSSGRVLP